jgi:hypothetical protein
MLVEGAFNCESDTSDPHPFVKLPGRPCSHTYWNRAVRGLQIYLIPPLEYAIVMNKNPQILHSPHTDHSKLPVRF